MPAANPYRMLIAGLAGVVLIEIYAAVMQRQFQNTDNRVGKGFAILGIYLFVVCYCTDSDQGCKKFSLTLGVFFRWYAQQYYMAVWCRGSSYCSPQQGDGSCRRISLHR